MDILQHVPEGVSWLCFPFPRGNKPFLLHGTLVVLAVHAFLVHLSVPVPQIPPQNKSQDGNGQHCQGTRTHAARIIGRVSIRIQSRANQRATLAYELQDGKAAALPRLAGLVVYAPRYNERDDVEEAHGGGVHGQVPQERGQTERPGQGQRTVAHGRGQGVQDDGDGARAEAVRRVGRQQDDDKGDEVGRRRERLRGQRVVAHVGHDLGQEDGQGGVGHVGEEEHGRREPGDGVCEDEQQVAGLEARGGLVRLVRVRVVVVVAAEAEAGDLFLALREVRR